MPKPLALLKNAIVLYRKHFSSIAPIAGISFLASFFDLFISSHSQELSTLAGFLGLLVTYLSYIAFIFLFSHENPETETTMTFYYKAWNVLLSYVWVSFLMSAAIIGGIGLLIIPGIIVGIFLSLSAYIVSLERLKGFQALTQSYTYVKGDWWGVLYRLVMLLCMLFVVSIVFGLIALPFPESSTGLIVINSFMQSFVVLPFVTAYIYLIYQSLKDKKAGPIIEHDVKNVKTVLLAVMFVGCLVILAGFFFFAKNV